MVVGLHNNGKAYTRTNAFTLNRQRRKNIKDYLIDRANLYKIYIGIYYIK